MTLSSVWQIYEENILSHSSEGHEAHQADTINGGSKTLLKGNQIVFDQGAKERKAEKQAEKQKAEERGKATGIEM